MTGQEVPQEITARLTADALIKSSLKSVIWFGSVRNNQDVHERSDCDLQVVLDEPSYELTVAVNTILEDYPSVDLSIMYMQDIYNHTGDVIFHDGTKSLFFMYVLAVGEILYGDNVYAGIVKNLSLDDIRPSLLVTIREYLSRLRVMAIQQTNDTLGFKKYSLKLFKDTLVYIGEKKPEAISAITNDTAKEAIQHIYPFGDGSTKALDDITNYDKNYTREEMAYLLTDYENIIERLCNE